MLKSLFADPINFNIKWMEVVHPLGSLGAHVEVVHGYREKVKLNGKEHTIHIPHPRILDSREEAMQVRRFLTEAGFVPPGV